MRSLFLKILISSFLTVICAGVAMSVLLLGRLMPVGGGWSMAPYFPVIGIGLSGLVCFQLTRHITSPLFELRKGADIIARGNLAARLPGSVSGRRDEIGQLGRDFDRMAERLESLVEGHKQLLGDVSHELRSPLSRLTVALGLVRRARADEMPELLDRVQLEAKRLDGLIDQLLMLSRIESGSHGVTASVDLTAVVQEVVADANFEAQGEARQVVLTSLENCAVIASEEMLRSAIENVVRNGVRFTREGTVVDVSLRRERDLAVIRVRDQGPGVLEARLSEIFLPFRRVQTMGGAGKSGNDGAGLGLAIAQRAVAANDGRIVARNAPDGGLVVEIEVPLGK